MRLVLFGKFEPDKRICSVNVRRRENVRRPENIVHRRNGYEVVMRSHTWLVRSRSMNKRKESEQEKPWPTALWRSRGRERERPSERMRERL